MTEERHHTDAEYDELKAKLDAMDGLLEAASETAIANGVRYEKAEAELEQTKAKLIRLERFVRDQYLLPDLEVALGIAKDREKKEG